MKIKKYLYILALTLTILIGLTSCKSNEINTNTTTADNNTITKTSLEEGYYNKLSEQDKKDINTASPEELVKLYYDSINKKQYDKAVVCASGLLFKGNEDRAKDHITYISGIKKVEVNYIKEYELKDKNGNIVPNTDTLKRYEVELSQEWDENSPYKEESGKSTRFLEVVKSADNRWTINTIATSP